MGPFYYVFIITYLVLLAPLLAQLPWQVNHFLLLIFWATELLVHTHKLFPDWSWAWFLRNPLRNLGPFMSGWCLANWSHWSNRNCNRTLSLVGSGLLAAVVVSIGAATSVMPPGFTYDVMSVVCYYSMIGLIFTATYRCASVLDVVRWLSDACYPIFLAHNFFIEYLRLAWPVPSDEFPLTRILVEWVLAVSGTCAFVIAVRKVVGEDLARTWIG